MTSSTARLGAFALVLSATALLATACATGPEPEVSVSSAPTAPAPAATSAPPAPEATPSPLTAPPCDELISDGTIASFEEIGWTWQEDVFRVGSVRLDEGIVCRWADFTTASDQIQMFGWAPISAADADAAQKELLASGWIEIESASPTVVITENPETAISLDAEGYGQTYEFGDGWVTFSDSKQSLLLIERPRA